MTENEKYEIAVFSTEVERTRRVFEAHALTNTPTDPIEAEKSFAAYAIARTEYLEAIERLARAQARIASSA